MAEQADITDHRTVLLVATVVLVVVVEVLMALVLEVQEEAAPQDRVIQVDQA